MHRLAMSHIHFHPPQIANQYFLSGQIPHKLTTTSKPIFPTPTSTTMPTPTLATKLTTMSTPTLATNSGAGCRCGGGRGERRWRRYSYSQWSSNMQFWQHNYTVLIFCVFLFLFRFIVLFVCHCCRKRAYLIIKKEHKYISFCLGNR